MHPRPIDTARLPPMAMVPPLARFATTRQAQSCLTRHRAFPRYRRGMKRDRKKGSRPEYEDLLYDETPSVVVYYPNQGSGDATPEPTVKRDRSTAFVPDLSELEPLTREQPAIEAEASSVTPLFPGRSEPAVDPAKPVPANLQNRGVLAWDPTHRDPGEEDGFGSFFRPQTTGAGPSSDPSVVDPVATQAAPAEPSMTPPPAEAAAQQAPRTSNGLRPVVFETDIIAADFIEADAIRADAPAAPAAPTRRTIIEELPPEAVDEDELDGDAEDSVAADEEAPGFLKALAPVDAVVAAAVIEEDASQEIEALGRPVEVVAATDADASLLPSVVEDSVPNEPTPALAGLSATEADFSSLDFDGPDTQMRFLQEWEAEVTGTHEAHSSNHTGRLFRSLRAHPQPETLPALRRDQAARFRSLSSAQDSGPVAIAESPGPVATSIGEPDAVDLGYLAPRISADEARIWTASSMSGLKPGLAYLIPLIATVVVGFANAFLLGPGIGWPTGVALVLSSVFGALRIRLVDASVAVIAPPLAFLAAAATAGQVGMSMAGGPVIAAGSNLFFALSSNVLWIVGATLIALAIVLIRSRRDRA